MKTESNDGTVRKAQSIKWQWQKEKGSTSIVFKYYIIILDFSNPEIPGQRPSLPALGSPKIKSGKYTTTYRGEKKKKSPSPKSKKACKQASRSPIGATQCNGIKFPIQKRQSQRKEINPIQSYTNPPKYYIRPPSTSVRPTNDSTPSSPVLRRSKNQRNGPPSSSRSRT